ncbi:MAG: hemerythrin domain-containing protein, partial [Phycisphaerales bacterium]
MPFIEWKDAYNIGVERLDEDHRHLVDLVNELHAGITRNRDRGSFGGVVDELQTLLHVLDELIDYAIDHCALEEECMLEHAYPGYADMRRAHGQLMSMVQDLRR